MGERPDKTASDNQPVGRGNLTRLGGFEILEKIGEGGMGVVYRARQASLDRIVALKVMKPSLAVEANFIESFQREAKAAGRLQHPNVVAVYDAGQVGEFYYYAMEFVHGKTLFRWVQRDGALPEKTVIGIALCVANALKNAWDKERLIHRDIKPENIIVDPDGNVKLCDLGLAKTFGERSSTEAGEPIFGTPQYMSPEQLWGRTGLDLRTDIYSLGMTLYYALTAQIPFNAPSPEQVMARRATEQLPDPRRFAPRLSPHVCRLLEKMLAKDVADRHQSWDEVIRDLELVHSNRLPACAPLGEGKSTLKLDPIVPEPVPVAVPVRVGRTQHKQMLAIVAVMLGAVVIGGVILAFASRSFHKSQQAVDSGQVDRRQPATALSLSRPEEGEPEASLPQQTTASTEARRKLLEALAFIQANKSDPAARLEFAERLRAITRNHPGSSEAIYAQQLLDLMALNQPQAAADSQQKPSQQPPNLPGPADQQEEPPWMQFVRPLADRAGRWAEFGAQIAKAIEEAEKRRREEEAVRLAEKARQEAEMQRLLEQLTRQEAARVQAVKALDKLVEPFLAELARREYRKAAELARSAATQPSLAPLREQVEGCVDAANRLDKFWRSFQANLPRLKGRTVPLQDRRGTITEVSDTEITLEIAPGAAVGIPIAKLTTAEIVALATAGSSPITANLLLDLAWFYFAERKAAEADEYLDAARKAGADCAATRQLMMMLAMGPSEYEAEQTFRQLRALVDSKQWTEARVKLDVLRNSYAQTRIVESAGAALNELERKVIIGGGPLTPTRVRPALPRPR